MAKRMTEAATNAKKPGGTGGQAAGVYLGDKEIREFRAPADDERLQDNRTKFNAKLKILSDGYKSTRTLNSFKLVSILGTGSFGKVILVQDSPQGKDKPLGADVAALKIISKERIIKTKQVEHTIGEKDILFACDSDFLVRQYDYMQDAVAIYLSLEFVNGGEMFTVLQRQVNRRFSAVQTRFFCAEIIMAFEYMHNLDIMHRDLKPENVLIDYRGHVKLTDFGFAKRVSLHTYTMCGTPEYLAPEIIANKGYTRAVDWWAVGVLTYEMRKGRSPFEAKDQLEMFRKITKCEFKFPRNFSQPERELILQFLKVDKTFRLGYIHGGVKRIKAQPYFEGLDWDRLLRQKYQSPFNPNVSDRADSSKFDPTPGGMSGIKWVLGKDKYGKTFDHF